MIFEQLWRWLRAFDTNKTQSDEILRRSQKDLTPQDLVAEPDPLIFLTDDEGSLEERRLDSKSKVVMK